ncbi:MAG TPA: [FeFe] hydrogenase H-cluster maturation GTPase HydF, partial [Ruminiclostridium sp.]|nr:[FeFe] hydrogenase H-cluster maturation GTPase HydF [Ruminiclostridium sp.]
TLGEGDHILIAEGCTHHRQCEDIGTVKLPRWIGRHTGKQLRFDFVSGGDFPQNLKPYRLVIHCGGCMLGDREVDYRRRCAEEQQVPMTNYGIAIAHMQGILERCIAPFPRLSPGQPR